MTPPKSLEQMAKVHADITGGTEYSQVWKNAHDSYLAGAKAALELAGQRLDREAAELRPHSDDMADATVSAANWVRALIPGADGGREGKNDG